MYILNVKGSTAECFQVIFMTRFIYILNIPYNSSSFYCNPNHQLPLDDLSSLVLPSYQISILINNTESCIVLIY